MSKPFSLRASLALVVVIATLWGCSTGPDHSGLGYVTPAPPDDSVLLRPESEIGLIYISARDCIYCARWEESELPVWERSRLRNEVRYTRVDSPSFRDTSRRYWPDDIAWVLGATWARAGTPRFVVIVDKQIFVNTIGTRSWKVNVMPALEMLVERRAKLKRPAAGKDLES